MLDSPAFCFAGAYGAYSFAVLDGPRPFCQAEATFSFSGDSRPKLLLPSELRSKSPFESPGKPLACFLRPGVGRLRTKLASCEPRQIVELLLGLAPQLFKNAPFSSGQELLPARNKEVKNCICPMQDQLIVYAWEETPREKSLEKVLSCECCFVDLACQQIKACIGAVGVRTVSGRLPQDMV